MGGVELQVVSSYAGIPRNLEDQRAGLSCVQQGIVTRRLASHQKCTSLLFFLPFVRS